MNAKKRILVLGSDGLVGSAIKRSDFFNSKNLTHFSNRLDADLTKLNDVQNLFSKVNPNVVVNCAGKVGGILANNTQRYQFLTENLKINLNIFEVIKDLENVLVLNLASSSIYPKNSKIPISESSLMGGELEDTNSAYSLAKIAGIEIGKSLHGDKLKIVNLILTNLYGPNDNFNPETSHVVPGLIHKFYQAYKNNDKQCEVWGSGTPLREFLFVDDLVDAIKLLIEKDCEYQILNIGSGFEISIENLAKKIADLIGFKGKILFDSTKPDGIKRKTLDSSQILSFDWKPETNLDTGLKNTYEWYKANN